MNDDVIQDKLIVGHLSGAFGIKGWLKVYSYTDPRENIFTYEPWFIRPPSQARLPVNESQWQMITVNEGKPHGKGLIAAVESISDRDQAEHLKGYEIAVLTQQLPDLEQDEYYWHQLKGLAVINKQGEYLGRVKYLLETGANDVLVVQSRKNDSIVTIDDQERLIPYLPEQVVLRVDLIEQLMTVDWPSDY